MITLPPCPVCGASLDFAGRNKNGVIRGMTITCRGCKSRLSVPVWIDPGPAAEVIAAAPTAVDA